MGLGCESELQGSLGSPEDKLHHDRVEGFATSTSGVPSAHNSAELEKQRSKEMILRVEKVKAVCKVTSHHAMLLQEDEPKQ